MLSSSIGAPDSPKIRNIVNSLPLYTLKVYVLLWIKLRKFKGVLNVPCPFKELNIFLWLHLINEVTCLLFLMGTMTYKVILINRPHLGTQFLI